MSDDVSEWRFNLMCEAEDRHQTAIYGMIECAENMRIQWVWPVIRPVQAGNW